MDLKRDERRGDEVEEEAELVEAARDDGRRPLVGGLSLHPRQHVLEPNVGVVSHALEHLFRYWYLQNRLQAIVLVNVRTKLPHAPTLKCMYMFVVSTKKERERDRYKFKEVFC